MHQTQFLDVIDRDEAERRFHDALQPRPLEAEIGPGETVLRRGELLTARETGVLAALGLAEVRVIRRPRVAIVSTGDEIIAPGTPMRPGLVYDSNATILADAVRELGGEPIL